MSKDELIEQGAAGIVITLRDGNIIVTHSEDGNELFKVKDALAGSWNELWNTIYNFRTVAEQEIQP